MKRSANDIVEQFAIASDFCLIPLLPIALTAAKANVKKQRDGVTLLKVLLAGEAP